MLIQQQGQYRFFIDSNTILNLTPLTTTISNTLQVNTINTNGDNNLVFQRNGSPYITFNSDRININQALHLADTLFIDTANKLSLKPSLEGGVNIFDIRNLHPVVDNPMVRFRVGEGGGETIVCEMTNNGVSIARNLIVGTAYELRTSALDTNGDNDLVFQRNGTEIFKCQTSAGIDNNNIINVSATGGGVSAVNVYGNSFKNRTLTSDTIFYGANSAGDNRVEYMKWNRADQSLDFNAPIDNTNIAVIGNIVDTTVSDERLKTNIQDVESNYCNCVKNVKIKTFEYKDEKYKDSDKYGFIAQHLQKHLPKEFDNIVKETKPKKDEGETYLSINYMKLSVVLWGALQETLNKVEHLESRLFEAEDEIKALRGKGKGETKPKAKSKSKAKKCRLKYINSMGSSASKSEETNEIKAVQEMDEEELSSKDKLFKKAIVEIYEEIKKVKVSKSDKIMYRLPVQLCNWSIF